MANISKPISEIIATVGQTLTAYEIFRVLQFEIANYSSERAAALRPQMMYNYSKNGLISKGRKATNGPIYYTVAEMYAFIDRYMKKNFDVSVSAPMFDSFANVDEISAELAAEREAANS